MQRYTHETPGRDKAPRVKGALIQLNSTYYQSLELPIPANQKKNTMVIAMVVGIHAPLEILTEGLIDISKLETIARLDYKDYLEVTLHSVFPMNHTNINAFFKSSNNLLRVQEKISVVDPVLEM